MTALLLPLLSAAPVEVAPAPYPVPSADQIAGWAADLSSRDQARRQEAALALVKAGPRAAPAVPVLIVLLGAKDERVDDAVAVLTAAGPAAKPAVPALLALLPESGASHFTDRLAYAVARIDGPAPEATRAVLLSRGKCNPILLTVSGYLHDNPGRVVPHLVDLCGDNDAEVRRRAVAVLGGLDTRGGLTGTTLLAHAGPGAAGVPAALERLLADEAVGVRVDAARAIGRVAPELAAKAIPAVVAAGAEAEPAARLDPHLAADALSPLPDLAADALIPLFDHASDPVRSWAVHTAAHLPVRERVEAVLAGGKTDLARAGAATALGLGAGGGPEAVPALTAALADRAFPVRFAAARALANRGRGEVGVPALVEGLKKPATREDAVHELERLGTAAAVAAPALRGLLADRNQAFALEAALALVAVAPADASDAVPALTRGLAVKTGRAGRAALALADLGPAAKVAVPDLVKLFGTTAAPANARISAAEAAARLDPAQAGPATEVIVALMTDKKLSKGTVRAQAASALGRIGPGAKSAVPALVRLLKDDAPFRHEIAVAAFRIDPSPANPALAWIRDCLKDDGHDDRYDLAEHVATLGPLAAPLVPDLVALLKSKQPYFRESAAEALGAVGPGAAAALPPLRDLAASDPRESVRRVAAAAVKQIEGK